LGLNYKFLIVIRSGFNLSRNRGFENSNSDQMANVLVVSGAPFLVAAISNFVVTQGAVRIRELKIKVN